MASSAVSPSRYSQEAAVARTAVKLATSMCKVSGDRSTMKRSVNLQSSKLRPSCLSVEPEPQRFECWYQLSQAAQLELQELKRQHLRTEKLVATTALR